jgi:hypothetical protein
MHDLLCKEYTDRELFIVQKEDIFNNMLYVWKVHLTRGQAYL